MSDDALLDAIPGNAAAPRTASNDGTSFSQHPIPDQIAADVYTRATNQTRQARRNLFTGFRFRRPSPSGIRVGESRYNNQFWG